MGGVAGGLNVIYSSFYEYKLGTHEPHLMFLRRARKWYCTTMKSVPI